MKIAVIDNLVSGHRETFYREFTYAWASMGHEVLLIAPKKPATMREVDPFKRISTHSLLPLPSGKPLRKKFIVLKNALIRLCNLRLLRKQLNEFHPDLAYFACLDDMLPTLAPLSFFDRLFPFTWSGLLVQSALPPYRKGVPDVRPFLRSKNCSGIGILNEYSVSGLIPFQKNIVCLPDFADLSAPDEYYPLLLELKDRVGKRKVVSLLGSIGMRKGIRLLLETIPLLSEDDYFFLIAGNNWLDEEHTNKLKSFEDAHPNCLFSLEHIPNEACFNALVEVSDVLFGAYCQFTGSSNLLTKAAAFNKPIVVSRGGCMGKRVEIFGFGLSIPENDANACCQALFALCQHGAPDPSGFGKYASAHSITRLRDSLQLLITHP